MSTQKKLIKGCTYTSICAGCGKLFEFIYIGKGPAIKRCLDCPIPSRENFKKRGNTIKSVCVYCEQTFDNLEQEHFIPVIHGGKTEIGNIVPACRSCNAHKHDKHPKDFCSRKTYNRITQILSSLQD